MAGALKVIAATPGFARTSDGVAVSVAGFIGHSISPENPKVAGFPWRAMKTAHPRWPPVTGYADHLSVTSIWMIALRKCPQTIRRGVDIAGIICFYGKGSGKNMSLPNLPI